MRKLIIVILMAFLIVGTGAAIVDIDVLGVYDRNNDGVIDETERVALDIDIENCRVDFDESAYAGMLTTSGTIILTEDVEQVAFGDVRATEVTITIVDEVVIPAPVEESALPAVEVVATVEVNEDEDDDPAVGYYIAGILLIILIAVGCVIILGGKDRGAVLNNANVENVEEERD